MAGPRTPIRVPQLLPRLLRQVHPLPPRIQPTVEDEILRVIQDLMEEPQPKPLRPLHELAIQASETTRPTALEDPFVDLRPVQPQQPPPSRMLVDPNPPEATPEIPPAIQFLLPGMGRPYQRVQPLAEPEPEIPALPPFEPLGSSIQPNLYPRDPQTGLSHPGMRIQGSPVVERPVPPGQFSPAEVRALRTLWKPVADVEPPEPGLSFEQYIPYSGGANRFRLPSEEELVVDQKDLRARSSVIGERERTEVREQMQREKEGLPKFTGTFKSPLPSDAQLATGKAINTKKARALIARIEQKRAQQTTFEQLSSLNRPLTPTEAAELARLQARQQEFQLTPREQEAWQRLQARLQEGQGGREATHAPVIRNTEAWLEQKLHPGARMTDIELSSVVPRIMEEERGRVYAQNKARPVAGQILNETIQQEQARNRIQPLLARKYDDATAPPWDRDVFSSINRVFSDVPELATALKDRYKSYAIHRSWPEDRRELAQEIQEIFEEYARLQEKYPDIPIMWEAADLDPSVPATTSGFRTAFGEVQDAINARLATGMRSQDEGVIDPQTNEVVRPPVTPGAPPIGSIATYGDLTGANTLANPRRWDLGKQLQWANAQRAKRYQRISKRGEPYRERMIAPPEYQLGDVGLLPRRVTVEGERPFAAVPPPVGSIGDRVKLRDGREGTLVAVTPSDRIEYPELPEDPTQISANLSVNPTVIKPDPTIPRIAAVELDSGETIRVDQRQLTRVATAQAPVTEGDVPLGGQLPVAEAKAQIRQFTPEEQDLIDEVEGLAGLARGVSDEEWSTLDDVRRMAAGQLPVNRLLPKGLQLPESAVAKAQSDLAELPPELGASRSAVDELKELKQRLAVPRDDPALQTTIAAVRSGRLPKTSPIYPGTGTAGTPTEIPQRKPKLPGKHLAALIGTAGAGLLTGAVPGDEPQEAEAGVRSWIKGVTDLPARFRNLGANPEMVKTLEEQLAPEEGLHTQTLKTRAATAAIDMYHYINSATDDVRKAVGPIDEEIAPDNVLATRVRGGLGPAEHMIAPLAEVYEDMPSSIFDATTTYLNLDGWLWEWQIVKEKLAQAEAKAAALAHAGDREGAERAYLEAGDLRRNIEEKTVTPHGWDEETILRVLEEERARLSPEELQWAEIAASRTKTAMQQALAFARDEGSVITPQQDMLFSARGPGYVPLHRLMEDYDEELNRRLLPQYLMGDRSGRAARVRLGMADFTMLDPEIRGSARINRHPIRGAVNVIEGLVNDGQRNRAVTEILDFFQKYQDKVDPRKQLFVQDTTADLPSPPGFTKVPYLQQGVPVYKEVNQDLANVLQALELPEAIQSLKLYTTARQVYHGAAAGGNLRFMLRQLSGIDFAAGVFLPDWGKRDNKHWRNVATKFLPEYFKGMFALYPARIAREMGVPGLSAWADGIYQRYQKDLQDSGFMWYGAASQPLGPRGSLYQDAVGFKQAELRGGRSKKTLAAKGFGYAVEGLQKNILEPNELAIKKAVYSGLKKAGYGARESAAETREYGGSPDWNKWGWFTKAMRDHLMFIGPAVQSINRAAKAMKRHPESFLEFLLAVAAVDFAIEEWNSQFRTEEGLPAITKTDRKKRMNNFVILTPEKEQVSSGEIRHKTIMIPKAYEAISWLTPVMSLKFLMEDQDYPALQAVADSLENWIPGGASLEGKKGVSGLVGSIGRRVASGGNPIPRGIYEQLSDTNILTGAPLSGTRREGLISPFEFTYYTDPAFIAAAQGIHKVTGGQAPQILTSPDKLQHLYNTVLPGMGESLVGVARPFVPPSPQSTAGIQSPTEQSLHRPVIGPIGRVFADPGTQSQERSDLMGRFIRARDLTAEAIKSVNYEGRSLDPLAKQFMTPKMKELASLNHEATKISQELSTISQTRDRVINDPAYSPAERIKLIRDLWNQEMGYLRRGRQLALAVEEIQRR